MIIIKSANYKAVMEGYIEDESGKIGREVTTSTNGVRKESYLRFVDEYTLVINRCDKENYDKLKNIFKAENVFEIKDTVREIEDGGMYFDFDRMKLNPSEDKSKKSFLYSGNLVASKL